MAAAEDGGAALGPGGAGAGHGPEGGTGPEPPPPAAPGAALSLGVAVLTASDTRGPADDRSGDLLARLAAADGHRVVLRDWSRDDPAALRAALLRALGDPRVHVALATGGTGLARRDNTPEAASALLERRLEGFGEAMRRLSQERLGVSGLQSRALAGTARGRLVFALPGSPGACRDAWEGLLRPMLDSRTRPCNLAEMIGRL